MKLHANWLAHLHEIRRREIAAIFAHCPHDAFSSALELGAGDGYQSRLLAQYTTSLVSTDFNAQIALCAPTEKISYRVCDAERVDSEFAGSFFDLVFSSNMLEHLPRPDLALAGIGKVLTPDGIVIHVVPTPFWKFWQVSLHIPHMLAHSLERLSEVGIGTLLSSGPKVREGASQPTNVIENNPKIAKRERRFVSSLVWPEPHGVSSSNFAEFFAFSRRRWLHTFAGAGLDVVAVIQGPVSSGFGFGFDRTRALLEAAKLPTEVAYIATSAGAKSRFVNYFSG